MGPLGFFLVLVVHVPVVPFLVVMENLQVTLRGVVRWRRITVDKSTQVRLVTFIL